MEPRIGVDYSTARPATSALVSAGATFVIRYVSTPGNPKNMSLAEVQTLNAAGLDVVTNYETTQGFMLGGYSAGVSAAKAALEQARAAGMPDRRPVYFSLDLDPHTLTDLQWRNVFAFLDGAASVLGRDMVGGYGGYLFLKRAFDAGKIAWGWQTYGWSGGVWEPRAQIQQFSNGQRVGGASVDYDRAMAPDFGQWQIGQETDDVSKQDVIDGLNEWFGGKPIDEGQTSVKGTILAGVNAAQAAYNKANHADAGVTEANQKLDALDPAKLQAAVEAALAKQGVTVNLDSQTLVADLVAAIRGLSWKVAA
jgi:hypothetical protein